MTIFWILTSALTALAGLMVMAGARRGVSRIDGPTEAETDRLSGQRELFELDRMKARGLLDEAEWTAARAEAARRLLAARRAEGALSIGRRDGFWVMCGVGLTAALALGLYVVIGSPGYGDQSYQARISEWAANPDGLEPAQVAAVMTQVVREKPDDAMALSMLGAARFEAGDAIAAASAFRRALTIDPLDAQNWARLGESLVRAGQGEVGPDAEAAFVEAVKLDDGQLGAHYFLGEAALARGDIARAERHWTPILAVLEANDPRRPELQQKLAQARAKAGQ